MELVSVILLAHLSKKNCFIIDNTVICDMVVTLKPELNKALDPMLMHGTQLNNSLNQNGDLIKHFT